MPSKFKKAIGAVKDQTSISLAKVASGSAGGGSNLEVLILKATRHDEVPIDERYVYEILGFVSSNKAYAADCASAIGRRIGRTRNWIVALKSLILVLRIFQDGDPYFPREVLHAMKRGAKILNVSSFRDDSNSNPWDYTAFVRTFALYLDERLDCFLTGKLQRRYTNREDGHSDGRFGSRTDRKLHEPAVREMKPVMLLDKISYWQRLIDRVIACRPTGAAKSNRLVQTSLYAVVQESFDLYKDISDGLVLLLDSFFHLQYQSCLQAFQACVRASKQFEELVAFYDLCKSNGVGRTSEYPSVQKISEELLETLQEFLKDQSSFPPNPRSPSTSSSPKLNLPPAPPSGDSFVTPGESFDASERNSDYGSCSASLEDLMSMGTSPQMSCYSDSYEKQEDQTSNFDALSAHSVPNDQVANLPSELVLFEDGKEAQKQETEQIKLENNDEKQSESKKDQEDDNWLLVLEETATKAPSSQIQDSTALSNGVFENLIAENSSDSAAIVPFQKQYNPFLEEPDEIPTVKTAPTSDDFSMEGGSTFKALTAPTFQAEPTFRAQNLNDTNELDPFVMSDNFGFEQKTVLQEQQLWLQNQNKIIAMSNNVEDNEGSEQKTVLQEQQLWLQNQNKIIAKHLELIRKRC